MFRHTSSSSAPAIVFLRGIRAADLEAVLDFIYNGEVSLAQDDLDSFINVAEDLKIKGMTPSKKAKRSFPELPSRLEVTEVRPKKIPKRSPVTKPQSMMTPKSSLDIISIKSEPLEGQTSSMNLERDIEVHSKVDDDNDEFGEIDGTMIEEGMIEPDLEQKLGDEGKVLTNLVLNYNKNAPQKMKTPEEVTKSAEFDSAVFLICRGRHDSGHSELKAGDVC